MPVTRWLVAALLACAMGCAKSADEAPPPAPAPTGADRIELVPAAEIARGKDACQAYVDRACACAKTVPAAADACKLAPGGLASLRTSIEVSQSPDSSRKDVIDVEHNIRKIVKSCVEETAKLPLLGCPQ